MTDNPRFVEVRGGDFAVTYSDDTKSLLGEIAEISERIKNLQKATDPNTKFRKVVCGVVPFVPVIFIREHVKSVSSRILQIQCASYYHGQCDFGEQCKQADYPGTEVERL